MAADKILWHGDFLDGKLSFILPGDVSTVCEHSAEDGSEGVLLYILVADGIEISGHAHIPLPVESNFHLVVTELMQCISEHYVSEVYDSRAKALANGQHMH